MPIDVSRLHFEIYTINGPHFEEPYTEHTIHIPVTISAGDRPSYLRLFAVFLSLSRRIPE
jgi:hypothetical protein